MLSDGLTEPRATHMNWEQRLQAGDKLNSTEFINCTVNSSDSFESNEFEILVILIRNFGQN